LNDWLRRINKEQPMKHFTLFTLIYLAAGVCLTAIALQHPDITSNTKTTLLINAGLLYLAAIFSTFPVWHRSQTRLRDKPAGQRNFVIPWLIIVLMLAITIPDLVDHNWSPEAIARASVGVNLLIQIVQRKARKRKSMKIAIAAASGNIGRRAAERVVQAGAETVLLTRQPEKLADLAAQGAIVKPISSDDTQGLIGPENLTLPEITAIISQVLNRSIEYVQVTVESIQQQLASAEATPDVQRELGNLFRALGNPNGIYATARTPEAFTPTTFEQFAIHKLLKHI
jgi:hypothetical protein